MNQIITLAVLLIILLIVFLLSKREQVSKAKSDKESLRTEKNTWSKEKVMEFSEIQSKREAMLLTIAKKFKDEPEQEKDLKEIINNWADLKIKIFTDRRSWVRNPD